ncbi:hypothetical protein [Spirulina subsalsa]
MGNCSPAPPLPCSPAPRVIWHCAENLPYPALYQA